MITFTSASLPPAEQNTQARSSVAGRVGIGLVLTATLFNVGLCFANTRHWAQVGSAHIAAVSIAILLSAMVMIWRDAGLTILRTSFATVLTVAALKLVNNEIDPKILFDLAIPPIFYLLGRRCTIEAADRMLVWLLSIVVAIGFVELLLPDLFQSLLDIRGYYTSKGAISADAVNYGDSNFFTSAQRSEEAGRTLLPSIFGQHRVSSVFLEPVSMGNFPIICLAWLLSIRLPWTTARVWLAAGILLCVVLPDSRQASATCLLMVLTRWSPWCAAPSFSLGLPMVVLAGLTLWGWFHLAPNEVVGLSADDFPGRLLFSGKLLASWGPGQWLGLEASPVYTADTGYAYLANNLSVILPIIVWVVGMASRTNGGSAAIMRTQIALYTATSLCIGESMFSIKTAALLWFLYGACSASSHAWSPLRTILGSVPRRVLGHG